MIYSVLGVTQNHIDAWAAVSYRRYCPVEKGAALSFRQEETRLAHLLRDARRKVVN